ncbi:MAG: ATP-binding protein, partial [Nanoarchaeota archaeon]
MKPTSQFQQLIVDIYGTLKSSQSPDCFDKFYEKNTLDQYNGTGKLIDFLKAMAKTLQLSYMEAGMNEGYDLYKEKSIKNILFAIAERYNEEQDATINVIAQFIQKNYPRLSIEPDFDVEIVEAFDKEAILLEETHYKEQFEESIRKLKEQIDPNIYEFYGDLKAMVEMVNTGYIRSLFVIGESGIGKTTMINSLLNENAVRLGGHITPKKLYETLYKYRENAV